MAKALREWRHAGCAGSELGTGEVAKRAAAHRLAIVGPRSEMDIPYTSASARRTAPRLGTMAEVRLLRAADGIYGTCAIRVTIDDPLMPLIS